MHILFADALSLGTECSGTKFAINCSLSADIPLQSAIRIAKFILGHTRIKSEKILYADFVLCKMRFGAITDKLEENRGFICKYQDSGYAFLIAVTDKLEENRGFICKYQDSGYAFLIAITDKLEENCGFICNYQDSGDVFLIAVTDKLYETRCFICNL